MAEPIFLPRGSTGEGYEGHYFWDTEMYLLPFFFTPIQTLRKHCLLIEQLFYRKAQNGHKS